MENFTTHIINEEKSFVICTKPPGVSSQAEADPHKPTMLNLVANAVSTDVKSVFPVHRLDNEVGGIMVYAKTPLAAKKLCTLVSERKMQKEYLAVIHGCPPENSGVFKDLLFKDSSRGKSFVVDKMRKGVKDASLEYSVISSAESDSGEKLSLVRVKLHTGRTHQIRVQFSSRNLPLAGDRRYGGKDSCKIALFSFRLAFDHPFVKGQAVDFFALPDTDVFPWNLFKTEIEAQKTP